jgi:hypothetical protein
MLLRIGLLIALLAGLAALGIGHFKVSDRINTLTKDLGTAQEAEKKAVQAESKAKGESRKAKEELVQTTQELTDTKSALETRTGELDEQRKRADTNFEQLTNVTKERNEAQQELAAYKATGVSPEQVHSMRGVQQKLAAERDTYISENKILLRNIGNLEAELKRYTEGREVPVPLPPGLKGRVVAVDPKYDFVVLDIGGNQGVLENGQMLVNRDGKLVARVRITRVEPNRSIANIMADWKKDEVMEDDQVFVY